MNSFRSVERAIAFEIERQARGARRRRDARPRRRAAGTTSAARPTRCGPRRTSRRLPLLPGAGPAAAARRPGLAGRDPRARCPSCRPRGARATRTSSGLSAYDAAVIVADPAMSAAFEAIRGADRASARQGRWRTSVTRRVRAGGQGRAIAATTGSPGARRAPSWPISCGESEPARWPGERQGGPRRAPRDRSDGGVDRRRTRASARSRTPTPSARSSIG